MSKPQKSETQKSIVSDHPQHIRPPVHEAAPVFELSKEAAEPGGVIVGERQDNLFTKVVPLDSKAFYLDVRENRRGKYLKLTESGASGRNTLLLSGVAIKTVLNVLDDAIKENYLHNNTNNETAESKPPTVNKNESENKWQTVYSQKVLNKSKKIYVDIMVNKRGRSLNIAEVSTSRNKTSVVMFERGWFQFKRALEEILDKFPELSAETFNTASNLPFDKHEPSGGVSGAQSEFQGKPLLTKVLELQNKKLFFDFLSNDAGRYLRVSEVRRGKRENVYIPALCFPVFAELLQKILSEDYTSSVTGLDTIPIPLTDTNNNNINIKDTQGQTSERSRDLLKRSLKVEDERGNNSRRYSLDLRENGFGKFLRVCEHKLLPSLRPRRPSQGQIQQIEKTNENKESELNQQQQYMKSSAVYFPQESFSQIRSFFIDFAGLD